MLLGFMDCRHLEQYIASTGKEGSGGNIGMDAKWVKAANPSVDGYMLDEDLGRQEPECVLFDAGLAKITLESTETVDQVMTKNDLGTFVEQRVNGKLVGKWSWTEAGQKYEEI